MQSRAATVQQYLDELPSDRRAAIEAVRTVVLANIDDNVEEGMTYGMIGYYIPHRVFPQGYHCDPRQPVPYASLASQKNYMSLYLMCAYTGSDAERRIREGFANAGKKLDMGKCCIRFRKLEDLPLDVVAEAIRSYPSDEHLAHYVATVGPDAWKKSRAAKS